MKVFMVGGTGLLGSEAAKELIRRGHEVKCIALPPIPQGAVIPPEMEIEYGNYLEMSDDEIRGHLRGCDGFVFAAGVDERVEAPAPIYDLYKKFNIDPIRRFLKLAKECDVRHVAICGSYLAHFAKKWPELEFTKWHPYIRSRIDQENVAMEFAEDDFNVAVLELPYIFGTQPGRKPVWVFLVKQVVSMKSVTMYPQGGTAMVTARQVGQALAGAIERNKGGNCYPIGYYNMTWEELIKIMQKNLGYKPRKKVLVSSEIYTEGGKQARKHQKRNNIEGGLNLIKLPQMQCRNQFIDKSEGCVLLGVEDDDIQQAIGDSVRLCRDVLFKKVDVVEMKDALK
ncbi:MAG: NAD(P)-dependent oxidoreductase [Hespellia sp.]|nr:NAD(P)-dependent oxidoreductase [Hespellia sp.]